MKLIEFLYLTCIAYDVPNLLTAISDHC